MKIRVRNFFYNRKLLIITNIIFVVLIFVLISIIFKSSFVKIKDSFITHDVSDSYLLTNPILDCEINNQDKNSVLFSDSVFDKVQQIKDKYSLGHISLYFRDLNNGPWVGVHEDEVFSPASLLKVPILIEFLHEAEDKPSILDKKVDISSSDFNPSFHQNIKFENSLVIGQKYTLSQVAEAMIDKSDNTAVLAMLQNINSNNIGNIFKAVGVPFKDVSNEVDVKVKDYAGFFRVLFNASYLNRDMSEKALSILSKSEYKDGIVAGVPSGIIVAHKFGERSIEGLKDNTQLHDCGIVYYPGKPYIICIMTRGDDFKTQSSAIQEISSYIYKEVDKKK